MNPPPPRAGAASHKRSRWGNNSSSTTSGASTATTGVSEEDALQALLSSAQAKQRDIENKKEGDKTTFAKKRPPHPHRYSNDEYDRRSQQRGSGYRDRWNTKDHGQGKQQQQQQEQDNYYGPASASDSKQSHKSMDKDNLGKDNDNNEETATKKVAPDFGLSGTLTKDSQTGNTYKGVVLKFREPPEARAPNTLWRFYVFKGDEQIDTLHISRQSAYLFGRNEDIADIVLHHASCSSQHAVLQYRALPNKETGKLKCCHYLMDLESTNGSFINGVRIDSARYYQLKKGDVLKFGASTREYVLLTANTKSLS
jgi:smad nuclear-interacting protein 1